MIQSVTYSSSSELGLLPKYVPILYFVMFVDSAPKKGVVEYVTPVTFGIFIPGYGGKLRAYEESRMELHNLMCSKMIGETVITAQIMQYGKNLRSVVPF